MREPCCWCGSMPTDDVDMMEVRGHRYVVSTHHHCCQMAQDADAQDSGFTEAQAERLLTAAYAFGIVRDPAFMRQPLTHQRPKMGSTERPSTTTATGKAA